MPALIQRFTNALPIISFTAAYSLLLIVILF